MWPCFIIEAREVICSVFVDADLPLCETQELQFLLIECAALLTQPPEF